MSEDEREQRFITLVNNERDKIESLSVRLSNNPSLFELEDLNEKHLHENTAFAMTYMEQKLEECSRLVHKGLTEKEIFDKMKQELDYLKIDLERIVNGAANSKQELERHESNLRGISEANRSKKENIGDKMHIIEKNVRHRFKVERTELKTVVATIFPDHSDLHDLIAEVISHYFEEGPDKYLKFDYKDNLIEQLELLVSTKLFERNQYAPLEIKMATLL